MSYRTLLIPKIRSKIEFMSFNFSIDQSYILRTHAFEGLLPTTSDESNSAILVSCFPEWYSHMTLSWSIPASWGNCRFNVYFSSGGTDAYSRLNNSLLTNPFFKDINSKDYSKFSGGNYVVEVVFPTASRSVRSRPVSAQYKRRDKIDKISAEIQRREYLLLSKFAGVKSFFFRRRHYGERCPRCWNKSLEKVMDDHCTVCYGTSWEGGYFDPIPVFIQFEATPSSRVKGYHGDIEPNSIGGWTISMPEIHPEDIILRSGDFNIYRVISVSQTELQTRSVRQMITLTQLSRTDVENKLACKIQLDGSIDYLKNTGGVYGDKRFPTNMIDKNTNNDFAWSKPQVLINLPKYDI